MDGAEVPEALHDWQQIQFPLPQNTPTVHQSGVGWEMAVVSDNHLNPNDDCSIFPPPPDLQAPEDPNSEGDEEENQRPQVGYEIVRRWRLRFEILRAAVFPVASRVRNIAVCVGGFWSIASVTGVVAAVLLSFLYVRVRRWRQKVIQESKDRFVFLLREKDEKINQLLLHIAQLNEVVSARRRVPVLRIG